MGRRFLLSFLFLIFTLGGQALAQSPDLKIAHIDEHMTTIHLRDSGDMAVVQKLLIDFSGAHETYDYILPVHIKHFEHLAIVDGDGNDISYEAFTDERGTVFRLYVDAENETYRIHIRYLTSHILSYGYRSDQLYLDLLHPSRPLGISTLETSVHFPEGKVIRDSMIEHSLFSSASSSYSQLTDSVVSFYAKDIAPFEPLSFHLTWDRGIIRPPLVETYMARVFYMTLIILLPCVFIFAAFLEIRRLKPSADLDVSQALELTSGIHPLLLSFLISQQFERKLLFTSLIRLATSGYIRFHARFEKGVFHNDHSYHIEQVHVNYHSLCSYDQLIMTTLFSDGRILSFESAFMRLRELNGPLSGLLISEALSQNYLERHPGSFSRSFVLYLALASVILLALALVIPLSYYSNLILIEAIALLCLGLLLNYLSRTTSETGHDLVCATQALKQYLVGTSSHNLSISHYCQLLPFAYDHQEAEQWTRHFSDLDSFPPSWYRGEQAAFVKMLRELVALLH